MLDRRNLVRVPLVVAFVAVTSLRAADKAVEPLAQAHAHNDYLHKRPLLDALDHGFTSVEADIFLVDGKLLVAHERRDLKPERTLQALYLDPLRARARANGGSVYPGGAAGNGGPITLLIDIKDNGEAAYTVLSKVLAEYGDVVSTVRDEKLEPKAVNVVISGSRPQQTMAKEKLRYAGYDGRMGDLDSTLPATLMPLVSDNWTLLFKWRGKGPIGEADKQKLDDAVARAHAHGRKIRFWATPDNQAMWAELQKSGVDLINTDNLAGLEAFLRSTQAK